MASTWRCEVMDVHRQTDVLFSLFVRGFSHHISPFVDFCLLFCCLRLHIVFGGFLHSNAQLLNEGIFLHSNASVRLKETILCCLPGVEETLQSWRSAISLIGFLHSNAQCLNEGTYLHSNASIWLLETIICCLPGVDETLQSWCSAISLIHTIQHLEGCRSWCWAPCSPSLIETHSVSVGVVSLLHVVPRSSYYTQMLSTWIGRTFPTLIEKGKIRSNSKLGFWISFVT